MRVNTYIKDGDTVEVVQHDFINNSYYGKRGRVIKVIKNRTKVVVDIDNELITLDYDSLIKIE